MAQGVIVEAPTEALRGERDAAVAGVHVHKWLVLLVVAVGGFMAALNSASLIIILPTLQEDLHTQLINIFWVLLAYVLASAVLLLVVGRLADLIGNKRIYLVGYAVFAAGSVLSALAPDVNILIAARFVQGIGGAMLTANASAIITHTFPKRQLGQALGITSMVYAVGTTLGPIVGGLLTEAFNWRWAFWVNLPIAVVGFILAAIYLYNEVGVRQTASGEAPRREGFDFLGTVLLAVSFSALLYFVSLGPMYGWGSQQMLIVLNVAIAASLLFIIWQLVARSPLLDLRLFSSRLFAMANFSASFASMGMIAVLFLLPFYLEDVLHYSLFMSAVLLTPFPLTMLVVAPISGYLSDRFGSRLLATAGMLISAASLASLSTLDLHSTYEPIAVRLVVLGLGMGLFNSPNNSAVMSSAPGERRGVASAVLGTMRNLGQMLGIGIIGAVFVSFMPFNAFLQLALTGETTSTGAQEVVSAFQICYLVATGFAVLGAITSLIRGKHQRHGVPVVEQGQGASSGAAHSDGVILAAPITAESLAQVALGSVAPDAAANGTPAPLAWGALGLTLATLAHEAESPNADPRLLSALSEAVDGRYPHTWDAPDRAQAVAREMVAPLAQALLSAYIGAQSSQNDAAHVSGPVANAEEEPFVVQPRKTVRVTRRLVVDGHVIGEQALEDVIPVDADTEAAAAALRARMDARMDAMARTEDAE